MTAVKRTTTKRTGNQLNVRRKKFVKNLVSGLGVGESALRAGYASRTEGTALLRDQAVLSALQVAMAKVGLNDEYLAKKIKDGLEAVYPEKLRKDGSVMQAEAPDYFTRGQYLDKALKIRGDYAPERQIQEQKTLVINVNMEMAKGLIDCGVITPEVAGVIDVGPDTGREALLTEGSRGEDRQEPQAVREDANAGGPDE